MLIWGGAVALIWSTRSNAKTFVFCQSSACQWMQIAPTNTLFEAIKPRAALGPLLDYLFVRLPGASFDHYKNLVLTSRRIVSTSWMQSKLGHCLS